MPGSNAIKRAAYSNGAKNDYAYDGLGRLQQIDFRNISDTVFDYIALAYDPVGMITRKERSDHYAEYEYDDAYRLEKESYFTPGDALKSYRAYTFDAAGNRKTMTSWNDASNNHTTTYNYGNRNQLTSHNGYQRFGSTSTGSMTYTWDGLNDECGMQNDEWVPRQSRESVGLRAADAGRAAASA